MNEPWRKWICNKCGGTFEEPGVVHASEYPGSKKWPYQYCPLCGANEAWIDEVDDIKQVEIQKEEEELVIEEDQSKNCDCWFHRYHVVHICECGELIDHSQGTMDQHRFCRDKFPDRKREDYPSSLYRHRDTPESLRERARLLEAR